MKKCLLSLLILLTGCSVTERTEINFDGQSISTDEIMIKYRKTPEIRETIILKDKEISSFIENFESGEIGNRLIKEGEREVELSFKKDDAVIGTILGFRSSKDELLLCLNDERICRVYNNPIELTTVEKGERFEESYKPIDLPIEVQGFKGGRPAPYYRIAIDMEKTEDGDIYTFVSATYCTLNGEFYLVKENGEVAGPILDEPYGDYDVIHSHIDDYAQGKLLIKDGEVTYLEWGEKPNLKPIEPLKISDFEVIDKQFKVHSNNYEVKIFEDYFTRRRVDLKLNENDEYISCLFDYYGERMSFILNKGTGSLVSEEQINNMFLIPVNEQVQQALKDIPVCSKYYEENYELSECYEPYVYNEGRIDSEITLYKTQFEINESGQIVLPVIIREKGAYAETIKVEIKKE